MRYLWVATVIAGAGLSACDSVEYDALEDFNDRSALNTELATEIAALPTATAADMPTSGEATYAGYAGIVIDTAVDSSLVGDAVLTADFADETIVGSIGDFVGSVEGGAARAYEGTLVIDDGRTGISTASGFGADVAGDLEGGGDVVGVDGSIFGNFRSDDDQGAAALSALSASGTDFTVNGTEYGGLMSIVAER